MSTAVNTIIPFNYGVQQLRSVKIDNEIWFAAKDCCEILEISWRGKGTLRSMPDEWCLVRNLRTNQGNQHSDWEIEKETYLINEPALYKLAFRSNKPSAVKFTNWVAGEVLPSLRKTGKYEARHSFSRQQIWEKLPKEVADLSYAFHKNIQEELTENEKFQYLMQFHALLGMKFDRISRQIGQHLELEQGRALRVSPGFSASGFLDED